MHFVYCLSTCLSIKIHPHKSIFDIFSEYKLLLFASVHLVHYHYYVPAIVQIEYTIWFELLNGSCSIDSISMNIECLDIERLQLLVITLTMHVHQNL